ncbi:MAG: TRAP transporter substrate-binding protein [Alphaproteobacteria bacterium]|nr:TRAP transporter substrate-binding protein [Rhodospirillales bacterium]MCW9045275.1 TRAP transporter substrate-binding protein [Alphaproteobacteria bacterium]
MKKFVTVVTGAAIGVAMMAGSAAAADMKLTMSSWLPAKHVIPAKMMQPWIDKVAEATEGRVKIRMLKKGLGHPKVHFDIAKDGLADVTYSVHGYTPGRFSMTKAAEFPFLGDSAEATSVAYWRVYKKHLEKVNEHKGVKLLGLMTHGPGQIHNSKKDINDVADFKGMKFRIGGGVVAEVTKSLGMTPLLASATKNYEYLSNGVADGTLLPKDSIPAFKITKLVPHTTIIPGGLYNTSFFLVMNQAKWDKISPADQKAIEAVSGEAFAKASGAAWDAADASGLAEMKANGNSVKPAGDNLMKQIAGATNHIEAAWVKAATEKGVDGAGAMMMFRSEVKNYK